MHYGQTTLSEDMLRFLGLEDHIFEGVLTSLPDAQTAWAGVELQPDGADIEARYVYTAATAEDRGLYIEPVVGDDVVVLIPNGNRQAALCFPGRVSPAKPKPESLGPGATLVHPEGTKIQRSTGDSVQPVVVAPLPADLKDAWSQLRSDIQTTAQRVALPPVAGATAADLAVSVNTRLVTIAADLATVAAQMATFEAKLAQIDAYLSSSLDASD